MANRGIRVELGAVLEPIVELEKLRLEHAQAMELGKKEPCGIGGGAYRIFGMRLLPLGKHRVGAAEIQVVHVLETAIKNGHLQGEVAGQRRNRKQQNRHAEREF